MIESLQRGAIRWRWVIAVGIVAIVVLIVSLQTCVRTGLAYGLWLDQCPDGELRQSIAVNAPSVSRGGKSDVSVTVFANYTTGATDERRSAALGSFTPTLFLVTATGEQALTAIDGWKRSGDSLTAKVQVPAVNDGDYLLRAKVTSSIGSSQLDLPLPLYAPARIHVLTDRPLYEPGNTVKFRAVALKANDLSPLDGRPGTWRVADPSGEVLLEEKAPAAAWGVVAGSFPLDKGAQSGEWTVTWSSGGATESRSFTVKPFTLPRFRVEAATSRPWFRRNERPVVKGSVRYASGAPVANAKLELVWSANGEWPPPTSWLEHALPKTAATKGDGSFSLELPAIPEDLQGQAHLTAAIAAIDASGDRVEGSADVLLSEDPIRVAGVSELEEGLIEGYNNRLYLRATSADGRVLDGVTLTVKRLWEPTDKGSDAIVDEDGVASLQVDPGPPVNVIIPAQPFRPPPRVKQVSRQSLDDYLSPEGEVALADRLAFDRVEDRLSACTRYSSQGEAVNVAVMVHGSGTVAGVAGPANRLGKCVSQALGELRFEKSRERLLSASFSFDDSDLPRVEAEVQAVPVFPGELSAAFNDAMIDVRDCLPPTVPSAALPRMISFRYDPKQRSVPLTWVDDKEGERFPAEAAGCLERRLTSLTLPERKLQPGEEEEPQAPAVGIARLRVTAPERYEAERPQPTVMVGYEFLVTAKKGREVLGSTKLVMRPGTIPPVRLRASEQILAPGKPVTIEIVRGPEFTGELPEKLFLSHGYTQLEALVDKKTRSAKFELPATLEGWSSVEWYGAKVFLFVQPKAQLAIKVTPEKERYAPGQVAQLGIETLVGERGGPAAVGLFGVDDSLAQLATLPGADELAKLRPQVTSAAAFGGLDAQALSLGRVRGKNAAAATLLRVSALPPPPQLEAAVAVSGSTIFDPNEALVDRFYLVLAELHVQTREWEAHATEKMSPQLMAKLWSKALDAVEQRKESARDAYGRRLRLHRLPADLLALTDPRQVVVNGVHLPEDTENWSAWVAKEKP